MKPTVAFLASLSLVSVMPAVRAQEEASLLAETRKTALPVLPKVVQAMQTAVQENGPVGAIPVCKEKAPQLLQEVRQQTGWSIRRVSLKTRNPATGTPDAWEVRQLADFDIQVANGAKPEQLEVGEIVVAADGRRHSDPVDAHQHLRLRGPERRVGLDGPRPGGNGRRHLGQP